MLSESKESELCMEQDLIDDLRVLYDRIKKNTDLTAGSSLLRFQQLLKVLYFCDPRKVETSFFRDILRTVDGVLEEIALLIQSECHMSLDAVQSRKISDASPHHYLRKNGFETLAELDEEMHQLLAEHRASLLNLQQLEIPAPLRTLPYQAYLFLSGKAESFKPSTDKTAEINTLRRTNGLFEHRLAQLAKYKRTYQSMIDQNSRQGEFSLDAGHFHFDDEKIFFLLDVLNALQKIRPFAIKSHETYEKIYLDVDYFLSRIKVLLQQHFSLLMLTDQWHVLEDKKLIVSAHTVRSIVLKLPLLLKLPHAKKFFERFFLEDMYFTLSTHAGDLFQLAGMYFLMNEDENFSKILVTSKVLASLDGLLSGDTYKEVYSYYQKKQYNHLSHLLDTLHDHLKNDRIFEVATCMAVLVKNARDAADTPQNRLHRHILKKSQCLLSGFIINFLEDIRISAVVAESSPDLSIFLPVLKGLKKIEAYDRELKSYLTQDAQHTLESNYLDIKAFFNIQLKTSVSAMLSLLHAMQFVELEKERKKIKTLHRLLYPYIDRDTRALVNGIPDMINDQLAAMIDRYGDASEAFSSYYFLNPPKDLAFALNKVKAMDPLYTAMLERLHIVLKKVIDCTLTLLTHEVVASIFSKKIRQLKMFSKTLPFEWCDFLESSVADIVELSRDAFLNSGREKEKTQPSQQRMQLLGEALEKLTLHSSIPVQESCQSSELPQQRDILQARMVDSHSKKEEATYQNVLTRIARLDVRAEGAAGNTPLPHSAAAVEVEHSRLLPALVASDEESCGVFVWGPRARLP